MIEEKAIKEITRELKFYLDDYGFEFTVNPDMGAYNNEGRIWCEVEVEYKYRKGWNLYLALEYDLNDGVKIDTNGDCNFELLSAETLWRLMFFDTWKDLLMEKRIM